MTCICPTPAKCAIYTRLIAVFIAAAFVLPALGGCQQRVVRQKSYYGSQFSNVSSSRAPTTHKGSMTTTVVSKKQEQGFFGKAFSGLGNLFGGGNDDEGGRVIKGEELQQLRLDRAREKAELDAARKAAEGKAESQRQQEDAE